LVGCESAGSAWNNIKDGFKPAGKSTGTRLVERYPVEVGENYVFEVTGSTIGQVWGTDQYTGDSSLSCAVVHAGILKRGQKGKVLLTIIPGVSSYKGSTRNGVTAMSWGQFGYGYTITKAADTAKVEKRISPVVSSNATQLPLATGLVALFLRGDGNAAWQLGKQAANPVTKYKWYVLAGTVLAGTGAAAKIDTIELNRAKSVVGNNPSHLREFHFWHQNKMLPIIRRSAGRSVTDVLRELRPIFPNP